VCLACRRDTKSVTEVVVFRDSLVGIATRYGLDGPRIKSRCGGARFSTPVRTDPGAHQASYTMGNTSFPGVKRPWRVGD